jgi:disulfide oxidoreductase YuzD
MEKTTNDRENNRNETFAEKTLKRLTENHGFGEWDDDIHDEGYNAKVTDFVDQERNQIVLYTDGSYLEECGQPLWKPKKAEIDQDVSRDGMHIAHWTGKGWNLRIEYVIDFRLLDAKETTLVSLSASVVVKPKSDPEIYWIHPLTGAKCQELDQAFQGWQEQNPVVKAQWAELVQNIRNDALLNQEICENDDNGAYVSYTAKEELTPMKQNIFYGFDIREKDETADSPKSSLKAINARIEVKYGVTGDWETIAEFYNVGSAFEAANAVTFGPSVSQIRVQERTEKGWICEYNRSNTVKPPLEKGPSKKYDRER